LIWHQLLHVDSRTRRINVTQEKHIGRRVEVIGHAGWATKQLVLDGATLFSKVDSN